MQRSEKRREISRLKAELRGLEPGLDRSNQKRHKKREIFGLKSAPGTTGALPHFVIIGTQKGGTTSLYRLLIQHPLVEPAATKEVHFFDNLFDEGLEWYRGCFPSSKLDDGRETVTGEATPAYLFHPEAPGRLAEVLPDARLVAMLRNPVDRAYSQYNQRVRKGRETLGFEEAIAIEEAGLSKLAPAGFDRGDPAFADRTTSYLSRGLYAEQLERWRAFLDDGRLLVLGSEDFFGRTRGALARILDHLGLPGHEIPTSEIRNRGSYGGMNPETRRRLEEHFAPHNRRLYALLGTDFGW